AIAGNLGGYLAENGISLVVPVNIPTNPGNLPAELALVIVSEMMGLHVLSSNHDFYWEGGKPAAQKQPGEAPGPRDHFFKNIDNAPFFALFRRLYPWNGKRWIQVNINSPQSKELVEHFGFDPARVFELGTSISDKFFEEFTPEDQKTFRRKMAYILSDGKATVQTMGIREHLAALGEWMDNQRPIVCGSRSGLVFDPSADNTIYCLQPTRVIARKRIEMDFHLLEALMKQPSFLEAFQSVPERQLVVHISGPVPIEHRGDLETVLAAYGKVLESVPEEIAARIFLAFSVGTEDHPALAENGLAKMNIEEIYRLATVILFPSETEGRGLPIIESSAGGIPIICSRYYPEEVFAEVVGEHLADEEQIRYVLFPEGEFSPAFLDQVAGIMLAPEAFESNKTHNKNAVRLRYSMEMVQRKFDRFIDTLGGTNA
ncbi:MAG: glycosyltransferase, partial [Verrucomicrobiota bacterium]